MAGPSEPPLNVTICPVPVIPPREVAVPERPVLNPPVEVPNEPRLVADDPPNALPVLRPPSVP